MDPEKTFERRRLRDWILPRDPRHLRAALALLVLLLAGESWVRRWTPTQTLSTAHYAIRSSAAPAQTREVGQAVEALHAAYASFFQDFARVHEPHPALPLNLYRDRREYRRCVRFVFWSEAMYRRPNCHAYYAAGTPSGHHWMVHEAVHQLNDQVAGWKLAKWLDEGIALYFSTGRLQDGKLDPSRVDPATYPIWWLDSQALSGDLGRDVRQARVIPLRAVLSGEGGPPLDRYFNLYYIHWWSLVRFLIEYDHGRFRRPFFTLIAEGGTRESFEQNIGPLASIEPLWYRYLQQQVAARSRLGSG